MRRTAVAAAALAALVAGSAAAPAAAAPRPIPPRRIPAGGASVWIPHWQAASGVRRTVANRAQVRVASPFWHHLRPDGVVASSSRTAAPVASLRKAGLVVLPTIIDQAGPAEAAQRFSDHAWRARVVDQVVRVAATTGADGVDLDFEHLAGGTHAQACAISLGYALVAEDAARRLHAVGRSLAITVMSRTADRTRCANGLQPTYDYARLGAAADLFRVMTYDFSWSTSAPGPVAPVGWVHQVAAYTTARVPASKVEVGVPTYGRAWTTQRDGRRTSRAVTVAQARTLAGRAARFDVEAQEWTATLPAPGGATTELWWHDARTAQAKAGVARRWGTGLAIWSMGAEDPGTFAALR